MITLTAPSMRFDIYIAGDYNHALNLLQRYVERGECVACTPCDYVYTYGREAGICVTLIHYPKHPRTPDQLREAAIEIGKYLLEELGQGSFTVAGPETTEFFSRRPGDQE